MFRPLTGALALAFTLATPAMAQAGQQADVGFARFVPASGEKATRLDWQAWDDALSWFVLGMGPSLRQMPPPLSPGIGTRFIWGHTSRYRLEGNRVAFQYMEAEQRDALVEYRADLERIGSEIDIASLPRNEQLAFWINLHNVAVIEQLALAYPVQSPSKVEINGVPLDDADFITVAGVDMSPKDIRTKIVYPNWKDPRVIYGFFRGDIGGPSIQRVAYTGSNISRLLESNANEFVNALRGVDASGSKLMVSEIYKEAQPFYFPGWEPDLRAHLAKYAEDDVSKILANTDRLEASIYETDIADLSKGEREPIYSNVESCSTGRGGFELCKSPDSRFNPAVQRYVQERQRKIEALIEQDRLTGTVIVREIGKDEESDEVD